MAQTTKQTDELLVELYRVGTPYLQDYPWEFESDRWAELLICSLIVGIGIEPAVARDSIHSLIRLSLLSIEGLASASAKERTFITHVFNQHGCELSAAERASASIVAVARAVKTNWDGYLQRFLREYGKKMANDLQQMLSSTGIGEKESRKISVLWLQNVANIPMLLPEDAHIQEFCKQHEISEKQLVDAADRLDLNIAVLDDLLALEASAPDASKPKLVRKRAKSAGT